MPPSPDPSALIGFSEDQAVPWSAFVRFLAQFSHDIRNGLNAIELQLTLARELSTDPEVSEEIQRARHSVADLAKRVQSARGAVAEVQITAVRYRMSEFLEDLEQMIRRFFPESAHLIEVLACEDFEFVADPGLLPVAFRNLLENSLHFRAADSVVRVATRHTANQVLFLIEQVQPEEPPIPPSSWGSPPLISTRRSGYGLGLFQARQILQAHHGSIEFEYVPQTSKLTTQVSLPRNLPIPQES